MKDADIPRQQLIDELAKMRGRIKELEESEKKYRLLFQNANDPIFLADNDLNFIDVNQKAVSLYGYTREEFLKMKIPDLTLPEQREEQERNRKEALKKGGESRGNWRKHVKKDGGVIDVEFNASGVNLSGKDYFISIIRDNTEQKRAEKNIARMEAYEQSLIETSKEKAYVESIINSAGEGIAVIDPEGRFIIINPAYLDIFGYRKEELIGKSITNVIASVSQEESKKAFRNFLKTGAEIKAERSYLSKSGEIIPVFIRGTSLRDEFGRLAGAIMVVRDLRDLKKREKAQQESEFKYRSLVEQMNEGVSIIDEKGLITFVNPKLCEMLKYHEGELIGRNVVDFIDKKKADIVKRQLATRIKEESFSHEISLQSKTGEVVPVLISATPIFENGLFKGSLSVFTDLSHIKKAEAEIIRTNNRLNAIINSATGFFIATSDVDGELTSWNKGAEIITGYTEEETVGRMNIRQFIPEEIAGSGLLEKMKQSIIEQKSFEGEVYYKKKSGEVGPVHFSSIPLKDERGHLIGMLAIVMDISERKIMERALKDSERRYRTIFETTGTAMCILEENKIISMANKEFERLTGYSKDEIIGKKEWTEFVVDDDQERLNEYHYARRSGHAFMPRNYEFRFINRDAKIKDIYMTVDMLPGTKKSITSLLDITERVRMETELRKARDEWEKSFDTIDDFIFITGENGVISRSNKALADLAGLHPQDVVGMQCRELLKCKDNMESCALVRLKNNMPPTGQEIMLGNYNVWVNAKEFPCYDKDGNLESVIHVYRNITERKKIEALTLEKQAAEEANRLKSEFINNISHEIRTPLTAILGFAETIERMIRKNQTIDKIPIAVSKILNSGEHLLDLVNDLLDISRIEAGKLELNIELLNMKKIVEEIEVFQKPKAIAKKIILTYEMPDDLPLIMADRVRLRQVIINLLDNAVKFTEEGGRVIVGAFWDRRRAGERDKEIGREGEKGQGEMATISPGHHDPVSQPQVTVWVKDTGIGIPENMLEAIFERFKQADLSGHRPGTGLGLSISKWLVEAQGGEIWADSKEGKGSTFYFTVPVADSK
ncbi:MAG: PAS domain S-box protein [Thermodesulfobacteriota bacterium]|nr:PAS domain S-box protein [Thermodesulfobacteriota bacterium]